jgi:hypothetical protein
MFSFCVLNGNHIEKQNFQGMQWYISTHVDLLNLCNKPHNTIKFALIFGLKIQCSMAECLPSIHKALSLILTTTKTKQIKPEQKKSCPDKGNFCLTWTTCIIFS